MLAMIGILESAGVVILTIGLIWRSWDRNARGPIWWMLIGGALLVIGLLMEPAFGRDLDGRYAQSPLKPWFDAPNGDFGLWALQRGPFRSFPL